MNVCFVFGTRPESIKLFPVALEFISRGHTVTVIDTSQQPGAVDSFFLKYVSEVSIFRLPAPNIGKLLSSQFQTQIVFLEKYLGEHNFDFCVVHGDTNSSFLGAMAGFYAQTQVVHVEAGLRSHNVYSPFPEEMNRLLVSKLAAYHAAPTAQCYKALVSEGISLDNIVVTGNTVIDAISSIKNLGYVVREVDKSSTNVLVMCHRRENRESALGVLCDEINNHRGTRTMFHVMLHPNPLVSDIFSSRLKDNANVIFVEPLEYDEFILLVDNADGVITDSGGLQEEVTYIKKPTIIFRNETERPEVLEVPYVELCESFPHAAVEQLTQLINHNCRVTHSDYEPFGNGSASTKIVDFLENRS